MKKLHFEKNLFDAEIAKKQTLIDAVNEFCKALASEGVVLTQEILTGYINGGGPFMEQTLLNETVSAFNRKGLQVNSLMMAGFRGDVAAIAGRFSPHQKAIQTALNKTGGELSKVSLQDGDALLTNEDKEEIATPFTHYLQDKDKELYDRLVNLAALLNEENQRLNVEIGKPLFSCIESFQTESSTWHHPAYGARLRDDQPFLKEDGKLIVNPLWFGARSSQ